MAIIFRIISVSDKLFVSASADHDGYMVEEAGEGDMAVADGGGLAGIEVADGLAVGECAIDVDGRAVFGPKTYQHLVAAVVAQHGVHVESLLATCGDDGIGLTDGAEPAEVGKGILVHLVPVHVGAERLVAVDVVAGVAETASAFVTVEYLGDAGSQQQGCGAVNHIVGRRVTVV